MRGWLIALLMSVSLTATAAIDTYEFKDESSRERFQQLTEELRCPKCQNQNLADSNSPIAKDLRGEVHRMLEQGESDNAIVDFMVARYGEFVLYRPRVGIDTYLLWYGPFALLAIGAVALILITRKRRSQSADTRESDLNQDERQQLNSILNRDNDQ